ncbi:MAG: HepT-like ribonuclease domain-containing protein [Gemmatimonadota bacterium]
MRAEERDPAHLWDMREAAREVAEFVAGASFDRFRSETLLRYAVEQQVGVVARAAERVSPSFRSAHPELPWDVLLNHTDLLTPERDPADLERVWRLATEHLPVLVPLLDRLIPPIPDDGV